MSNKTFSVLQYSSVATALLAISNDINAQIIYEDVNPDLVYGDDILIDLDLDGNNDFRFTKSHFGTLPWVMTTAILLISLV